MEIEAETRLVEERRAKIKSEEKITKTIIFYCNE